MRKYKNELRRILIIGLSFLITGMTSAQLSGFGVGLGASATTFEGESMTSQNTNNGDGLTDNKIGGTGGIRFDFDLKNEVVKLSPEVFIIQNGSKEYYNSLNQFQDELFGQSSVKSNGNYR